MIQRTYDNVNDFYADAMIAINRQLGSKLRMLGVTIEEIPELVDKGLLIRLSSTITNGTIKETYEYSGIKLIEVEWSPSGIKQVDINKDEREFKRNN